MATTATIAIARAGFIHAVEVGGGFSVGILSKVAMGQYSHCPARTRLNRPSGCAAPDVVGADRSPERACSCPGVNLPLPGRTRASHRFGQTLTDRKSTRLNSSHVASSYAVFCL